MNNNVRVTTLDNGFRIVTERMPGLKSASLGVWVSAGCRNERLQQNGIAHYLRCYQHQNIDDIFTIQENVIGKSNEWNLPLWMASLDLSKPFDRIEF